MSHTPRRGATQDVISLLSTLSLFIARIFVIIEIDDLGVNLVERRLFFLGER
jgi:hypothetical protein